MQAWPWWSRPWWSRPRRSRPRRWFDGRTWRWWLALWWSNSSHGSAAGCRNWNGSIIRLPLLHDSRATRLLARQPSNHRLLSQLRLRKLNHQSVSGLPETLFLRRSVLPAERQPGESEIVGERERGEFRGEFRQADRSRTRYRLDERLFLRETQLNLRPSPTSLGQTSHSSLAVRPFGLP